MARARNPNREKALQIWLEHGGNISNREIADMLGEKEKTISVWKLRDRWNEVLQNGDCRTTNDECSTTKQEEAVSWAEIETEYVTDIRRKPCTLRDLAEKYGVPLQTVKEYAARNEWTEKRNQHRTNVIQKTAEKTAELVSNDIAQVTARHLRLSNKLLEVIEEALHDEKQFYKYVEILRTGYGPGEFDDRLAVEVLDAINEKKLQSIVSSLQQVQRMQRQTLGILDEKEKRKLEIEEAKHVGKEKDAEATEEWVQSLQEVAERRRLKRERDHEQATI